MTKNPGGNDADLFVAKFATGGELLWGNRGGGPMMTDDDQIGADLAFHRSPGKTGNIAITGWFYQHLYLGPGPLNLLTAGFNAFFAELGP